MALWHRPYTLEDLKFYNRNMSEHLGMEFTEITPDSLSARLPVDHRTKQPMGLFHGGASCVLGETLGSVAANLCLNPDTHFAVGMAIEAHHLRSVTSDWVTAVSKALHIGSTTHVWDTEVFDPKNKRIAVVRLTVAIREKRPE